MSKLSVNINKIATLRNARGGDVPNLVNVALDCEKYGAQGITVHPRPDERHIRYSDVYDLKKVLTTEFNIEGYPNEKFIDLVSTIKPEQVTLVPDPPGTLTSDAGWDLLTKKDFLNPILEKFRSLGIRTSIFMEPDVAQLKGLEYVNVDRVEFYTGPYAGKFSESKERAIEDYVKAASLVKRFNVGINAGHDLSLENVRYFKENIPELLEVSIGHALIAEALYMGLKKTIQLYLEELK